MDDTSLSDEARYALAGAALDTYYEKGGETPFLYRGIIEAQVFRLGG